VKIALVQINPIIGDFRYNCDKILRWAQRARHEECRLAIFPEMAVSGYPPQDLLERSAFITQEQEAIDALIAQLPEIDVLFGCFEKRSGERGKKLYNTAVAARNGKIVFRAHKQLLPTYDVFDETRYFEPGGISIPYVIEGHHFGVTVCEDIWNRVIEDYDKDPVALLHSSVTQGKGRLDGIINISASPFQRNKEVQKQAMFRELCRRHALPLIYVNQVGGQDSLLFDGRSLVMDASGEITAKGAGFEEDMVVVDSRDWRGDFRGCTIDDEVGAVYSGLVMGVRDYVRKCGFSSVALGVSGGIDSALTAAIAVEALGPENVMAVALPSQYSSPESKEDAEQLAKALGCRFEVIPIDALFDSYRHVLSPLFSGLKEEVTEQNIQARIRGNLLMALSNKFGSLLLTTGNKSEMAVGYCTLYGDMSGGLAVIADVPKMLVYELSRYVNREREIIPERTLTKPPSAELKPDQRDQDDLPPYEILDRILELYLEKGFNAAQIVARGFDQHLVHDVLRRIRINEYKRKQAPLGLKVTSKAFGYGRRFPNVQNFQE
jgi:NAD+ synthetase